MAITHESAPKTLPPEMSVPSSVDVPTEPTGELAVPYAACSSAEDLSFHEWQLAINGLPHTIHMSEEWCPMHPKTVPEEVKKEADPPVDSHAWPFYI